MTIQYPVRISLTDETLIVDRDNVEVATTFFGQEDYDAEYERRSADAAFIVKCLNERATLTARIKALEEENEGWKDQAKLLIAAWPTLFGDKKYPVSEVLYSAISEKDSTHA